jgi:hypothetical protein
LGVADPFPVVHFGFAFSPSRPWISPAVQCREVAALSWYTRQRNIGRTKKTLEDDAADWLLLASKEEVAAVKWDRLS